MLSTHRKRNQHVRPNVTQDFGIGLIRWAVLSQGCTNPGQHVARQLNFMGWRLIFMDSQYGSCLTSPFWFQNFLCGSFPLCHKRWLRGMLHVWETKELYEYAGFCWGNLKGPPRRPRLRWKDNFKMDLKEIGWGLVWLRIEQVVGWLVACGRTDMTKPIVPVWQFCERA